MTFWLKKNNNEKKKQFDFANQGNGKQQKTCESPQAELFSKSWNQSYIKSLKFT